jgi:hypothetical protein
VRPKHKWKVKLRVWMWTDFLLRRVSYVKSYINPVNTKKACSVNRIIATLILNLDAV